MEGRSQRTMETIKEEDEGEEFKVKKAEI